MGSHPDFSLPAHTPEQAGKLLAEPFPPWLVRWKPQTVKGNRCLPVAYITAKDVLDRLDDVFGWECWQSAFEFGESHVHCVIKVYVGGQWIEKGAAGGYSANDNPGHRIKGGESDAVKRAGLHYGIGRYLHGLSFDWVDYDSVKKCIPNPPKMPAWALPAVIDQYQSDEIGDWVAKVGGNIRSKILELYRVKAIEELPLKHFDEVMRRLKAAHARAVKIRAEKESVAP